MLNNTANELFSTAGLINIAGIAALLTTILLAAALLYKMRQLKQSQAITDKLKRSLDEMDEQAKLIVRTDMELNKTQEELDKKIIGLYTLQKLSKEISTTLEENQIFKMISIEHLQELGFEKTCGFLWNDEEGRFVIQVGLGYSEEEIESINSILLPSKNKYMELLNNEKTVSSISSAENEALKQEIQRVFKVKLFIVSPILPKEGNKGFLFVGTERLDTIVNEGDEELITILANQIGQALENARLFEKTWKAQQSLENKVKERTQELTQVLNEMRIINKRKTDFISSVSHELRTPLTSIKGYASILLAGKLGNIPEDIRQRLAKINKHSDELVHMVNDLLDIARIESGRVAMKKEPLNLKEVSEEIVDLLSIQAKEKEIEISSDIPNDAKVILADRRQIERVFINIIGNAIKFTPKKGAISISARKTGNLTQIDISDTGCGIPAEAQEAVFEEFYRVNNVINEEVKGTGLGLSLVKHIVEAHGGKIWAQNNAGKGATFSLAIPQNADNH